ncbi:MAG: DUF615 domain-containing protein [Parasutterella sp.]
MIADDAALTKFIAQFPDVNVQEVRQLIRNARKEAEGNKPPKSARALYKLILRNGSSSDRVGSHRGGRR